MKYNELFSLTDFAKFSGTKRDTLCNYDRIGLLSPIMRDEKNNYRYYSGGQLAVVNVIRTLQALGMSFAEIKKLIDNRTPEQINTLLLNQIDKIEQMIDRWVSARRLLSTLQKSIYPVLNIKENAIKIEYLQAEAIILGGVNDYSNDKKDYEALYNFYDELNKKYPGLDLNYPVWGMFSEERLKYGDWDFPDRYYFYNPRGYDERPAGLYAIGYSRGSYGKCDELYKRLVEYIDGNDFEICGNGYEEYPLNEICVSDEENYLVRVMITVQKKNNVTKKAKEIF